MATGHITNIQPNEFTIGLPLKILVNWETEGTAWEVDSRIKLTDENGTVYHSPTHKNIWGGHEEYSYAFTMGAMPDYPISVTIELELSENTLFYIPFHTIEIYTHIVQPTTAPVNIEPPFNLGEWFNKYGTVVTFGVLAVAAVVITTKK